MTHSLRSRNRRRSGNAADWTARWNYLISQSNTSGHQLWYDIANAGMTDAATKSGAGFATIKPQADTRLTTIRTAHASLSRSLADLLPGSDRCDRRTL